MAKDISTRKVGRNAPCPCGSGLMYKFCCITRETGNLQVPTSIGCSSCGQPQIVDLTKLPGFQIPDLSAPLRMFAHENGIYLFESFIKFGQVKSLTERLQTGRLTADELMSAFQENATRNTLMRYLELASGELACFMCRFDIIRDTINAHFDAKYTLTVPVGFILLEGVLREIGAIELRDDLAISIPVDRWENRLMPEMQARARSFRAFINSLYIGGQSPGTFNRNPVLHGGDTQYNKQFWSLMLLMTLFEIRTFAFFRAQPEIIK